MTCNNDFPAIRPRKQRSLQDSSSSPHAGPSTWTRTHSSLSLLHDSSSQADLDNPLDTLYETTLDSDLDQHSTSSATLLSYRVSPAPSTNWLLTDASCASSGLELSARPSESRQCLYPLYEPGQLTARRTLRLRSRTAAVIRSLPATSEESDEDEHEPCKAAEAPSVAQAPKLRRIPGVRDLRRAFREGDRGLVHFTSESSLGISKASYELGILASPTAPLSPLSPRSSLRTLVDLGNGWPQGSGDLKTLCGSTFSSMTIASRFTTKVHSTLSSWRPSQARSPSDPMSPSKRLAHDYRPRRHTSLGPDTPPTRSPGLAVWSCAKISQSSLKRAARRGPSRKTGFSATR